MCAWLFDFGNVTKMRKRKYKILCTIAWSMWMQIYNFRTDQMAHLTMSWRYAYCAIDDEKCAAQFSIRFWNDLRFGQRKYVIHSIKMLMYGQWTWQPINLVSMKKNTIHDSKMCYHFSSNKRQPF